MQNWQCWGHVGWVFVAVTGFSVSVLAGEIRFTKPIDCVLGESCFVQNYVDHDPGAGAKDLFCGPRTFNRHTGTDFRVPHLQAMRDGVAVLAAAPGRVGRTFDGMADISFREIGDEAIKGKSCGNGVFVDHGGGWRTIYCHMRKGSVAVRSGDQVRRGQKLGLVGLSGRTEFPHVHFEVRHRRTLVDPFAGPLPGKGGAQSHAGTATCGGPRSPLWHNPVANGLVYAPAAVIGAGFSAVPPSSQSLEAGQHLNSTLRADAPALLFWVRVVGLLPGDRQALVIVGPDGKVVTRAQPSGVDRPKALAWRYVGRRISGAGWSRGTYRGEYRLARDGRLLLRKFVRVRVE